MWTQRWIIGNLQSEEQKEKKKRLKKKVKHKGLIGHHYAYQYTHMGFPKGERERTRNLFKGIIAGSILNLGKQIDIQIQ